MVLAHLSEHLSDLLPEPLTLVAAADQMVLAAVDGRRTRTLVTQSTHRPQQLEESGIGPFARTLLGDVQDLVSMYLHAPWPLTADGRVTYPVAASAGGTIEFGFRASSSAGNDISLPPLVLDALG